MSDFVAFWEVLKLNVKYLLRSKTVLGVILFSIVCQGIGMKVVHAAQINFQGVMLYITGREAIFVALFIQVFCGAFLTIVYGIWGIPHLHRYPRAELTYVLPVKKWIFPLSYAISFLLPLVLQYGVLLLVFGAQFGWSTVLSATVPWGPALTGMAVQLLAFEMALFFFAFFSIWMGQVPTLFFGTLLFIILQSVGALIRTSFWKLMVPQVEALARVEVLYKLFPPMGELTFALREIFSREGWEPKILIPWFIWLLVFVGGFRWCLRRPLRPKVAE